MGVESETGEPEMLPPPTGYPDIAGVPLAERRRAFCLLLASDHAPAPDAIVPLAMKFEAFVRDGAKHLKVVDA